MSKSDKPAALAVVGKPAARGRGGMLPKSPDVDEGALQRAESAIGHAPATGGVQGAKIKTSGRRRKKKQREEEVLYIKGPKAVIDAFMAYKEKEEFKANWDALLDLMERAGIEVEDFNG